MPSLITSQITLKLHVHPLLIQTLTNLLTAKTIGILINMLHHAQLLLELNLS